MNRRQKNLAINIPEAVEQGEHIRSKNGENITSNRGGKAVNLGLFEENRALNARLIENEQTRLFLTHIIDSLRTGVVVADADAKVIMANIAAQNVMGFHASESDEINLPSVLSKRIMEFSSSDSTSVYEKGGSFNELVVFNGPNNRLLSCNLSSFPWHGEGAGAPSVIILIEDVTEQVLVGAQRERSQTLSAMGEMAAEVAHQIRNPLGGIELFASILGREVKEDESLERLTDNILNGVSEINHIITNYLVLARPLQPIKKFIDVNTLIDEALIAAQESLKHRGIAIQRNIPNPVWIEGDPELLLQVLLNIILNAVEAHENGGVLGIDLAKSSNQATMTFSDTGKGIPSRDLGRIFSPFFTSKQKNLGLGLAVSHRIIDAHHGLMQVKSRLGRGTTVTITLPAGGCDHQIADSRS